MEEQKRILVVEDDPAIQDAVRIMLERRGYKVAVLDRGDSLMEGDFEHPHLFILDKQLPGIDGLDICRHLKIQASTMHIPVLMLSASPQIGVLAGKAAADGFLEKPFQMPRLRELVSQLVNAVG